MSDKAIRQGAVGRNNDLIHTNHPSFLRGSASAGTAVAAVAASILGTDEEEATSTTTGYVDILRSGGRILHEVDTGEEHVAHNVSNISEPPSSSSSSDSPFEIFLSLIVSLIVVCFLLYLLQCIISCIRRRLEEDDDTRDEEEEGITSSRIMFNLTALQRRAVLETIFSDSSKAVTPDDFTKKKHLKKSSPRRRSKKGQSKDDKLGYPGGENAAWHKSDDHSSPSDNVLNLSEMKDGIANKENLDIAVHADDDSLGDNCSDISSHDDDDDVNNNDEDSNDGGDDLPIPTLDTCLTPDTVASASASASGEDRQTGKTQAPPTRAVSIEQPLDSASETTSAVVQETNAVSSSLPSQPRRFFPWRKKKSTPLASQDGNGTAVDDPPAPMWLPMDGDGGAETKGDEEHHRHLDDAESISVAQGTVASSRFGDSVSQVTDGDEELPECAICLSPYEEGNVLISSKRCSHLFHKDCILEWLEKNDKCPCCRADMFTPGEINAAATSLVGKQRMIKAMAARVGTPQTFMAGERRMPPPRIVASPSGGG